MLGEGIGVPVGAGGCWCVPLGAGGCLWVPVGTPQPLSLPPPPPQLGVPGHHLGEQRELRRGAGGRVAPMGAASLPGPPTPPPAITPPGGAAPHPPMPPPRPHPHPPPSHGSCGPRRPGNPSTHGCCRGRTPAPMGAPKEGPSTHRCSKKGPACSGPTAVGAPKEGCRHLDDPSTHGWSQDGPQHPWVLPERIPAPMGAPKEGPGCHPHPHPPPMGAPPLGGALCMGSRCLFGVKLPRFGALAHTGGRGGGFTYANEPHANEARDCRV